MHAPVPMLSGLAAKGNTALVIGLLVGLAVMATIKTSTATPASPQNRSPL